ncbi:hypothetical protein F5984_10635 [Rudanella paleaurantiibacter]|uniref:UPF0323 domain-containing protein n=1 Tax=Rudanella paleaurantiibacter TaxID=2614655 RepID=A0A7J5U0P3_9BACT|nr:MULTISPECIES: hypothetical protein [Rudanella]KAB7731249.1 hypothetical protein F5984_10635 [Rudanella paleaurantiibacter]
MTPTRKQALIRRVKDITLGTTLTVALLNGSVLLQSCGGSNDDGYADSGQADTQTETYKKGVLSYITETAPGNFKITDEQQVGPERAGAIVSYFDGHRDTLSVAAAQALVRNDPSTSQYFNNPSGYNHGSGLANALLWGGLGYMIGRQFMGSGPNFDRDRRYSQGVYTNPSVYARSSDIGREVSRSRVVTSRPSGSRGGFFSRGRSGGFSS